MDKFSCIPLACIALFGAISAGHAGGFQRGQADTDLLYETGSFASRFGLSYINPARGFDKISGVAGDYGTYTGDYELPSVAVKFGGDRLACVATYVRAFAAEADYTGSPGGALPASAASPFGSRNQQMEFDSDEVAGTCRGSYDVGRQRFSLLGGLYAENFDFSASSLTVVPSARSVQTPFGLVPVYLPASIEAKAKDGLSPGFRTGFAYEIPDIALRAQVLYRSQTTHVSPNGSASGVLAGSPFIVAPGVGLLDVTGPLPLGSSLPIPEAFRLDDVVSPQSLGLSFQSGIAPGTLLTASFRWTDWSTNREFVSRIGDAPGSSMPFHWRDGYTASLGFGRVLADNVSVLAAVGFDSGVSTGAETTYTDLYTLSGGVSFKQGIGEVRFGGLIGYWTSGAQTLSDGALFEATVGDDLVYALNGSLRFAF